MLSKLRFFFSSCLSDCYNNYSLKVIFAFTTWVQEVQSYPFPTKSMLWKDKFTILSHKIACYCYRIYLNPRCTFSLNSHLFNKHILQLNIIVNTVKLDVCVWYNWESYLFLLPTPHLHSGNINSSFFLAAGLSSPFCLRFHLIFYTLFSKCM